MRLTTTALLAALLVATACSDDDEPRAQATTTSGAPNPPTTTCEGADPVPPEAADGSPAEIVATAGELTFAIVDHGASVDVVAVFRTVDCAFEPVVLDGAPMTHPVGGSVTHGEGLACDDGGALTVLSATSEDGTTYSTTAITYEVDGGELVEVAREEATVDAVEDPGALDPYYRLDC